MTPVVIVLAIALITIIWLRREKQREAIAVGLVYLVVIALLVYVLSGLDLSHWSAKLSW